MSLLYKLGYWFGRRLRLHGKRTSRRREPNPDVFKEDRPLSDEERLLLRWLIEHGSPEARDFAGQIDRARVVGSCTCGCPTIDLGIDGEPHRTTGPSQVLGDFAGKTPEGCTVGVILHAREGKLSELEVYNFENCEGTFSLPTIPSLRPGLP